MGLHGIHGDTPSLALPCFFGGRENVSDGETKEKEKGQLIINYEIKILKLIVYLTTTVYMYIQLK